SSSSALRRLIAGHDHSETWHDVNRQPLTSRSAATPYTPALEVFRMWRPLSSILEILVLVRPSTVMARGGPSVPSRCRLHSSTSSFRISRSASLGPNGEAGGAPV